MPRKRKEIPELEKMLQYGKKKFVRYDEGAKLYSMGLQPIRLFSYTSNVKIKQIEREVLQYENNQYQIR